MGEGGPGLSLLPGPTLCSPQLSLHPDGCMADEADGMWLGQVCLPSSEATGILNSSFPLPSLLFLLQACQLPRNPLHSITSRGRQSPSLSAAFWELLHPRLGHLHEIQAIPRKVRVSSLLTN